MSNKFEEEVSKERYNANCKRFQLVNSNKDAFSIEMVAATMVIAKSLFELNESVKFLVEEIKKDKKNDT